MKTNLYTIVIHFQDHRNGIHQCEATSPGDAFRDAISSSESLDDYDRQKIFEFVKAVEKQLVHVADNMKGFWIWVAPLEDEDTEEEILEGILGGYIIQTDKSGPKRESNG
ncbi:MAG: hypothetical protein GY864_07565 [Desulfobacterales bacterium]|nr:hypothetical protein [Desulfobacterales bacterium]